MSGGRRRLIGSITGHLVLGMLLAAGILKGFDLPAFERSLRTWAFVPRDFTLSLSLLVMGVEIALGGLWFLGRARRAIAIATFCWLAVVTGVFAVHVAFTAPPDCACFGALDRYLDGVDGAWAVLARNGVLLMLLGVAICLVERGRAGRGDGKLRVSP